jgi:hypothetical protein
MSGVERRRCGERPVDFAAEIRAFEAGDVDPRNFGHEAHVHLAWAYLQLFPTATAIERFTGALRSLTARLGIAGKYHETISWFFMLAIAERISDPPACRRPGDWDSFKRHNRDLLEDGGTLLRRHYSQSRLDSAQARQRFLLPDRAP